MYIFDIFVFTYLYFQYMNDNKLPKNVNKGWSSKTKKMNIIVGTENNPTDFTSGETIINKKSTKNNLDKLIEINNDVNPDVSNGKTTTDAEAGGLLKGKPHYDSNGNPTGGIPGIVDGQKPIETEGEEFVVNAEASKKHWKELSEINQQDGNGVPIGPPAESFDDDPAEEFENGGKIQFNPNYLPSKWIMSYAKKIKSKHPEIWKLGGNIFGNEAFENLKRVSERGYWLDSEEWMYVKWRSYVARHKQDFRIEGVVAMLKWVDKVDKGWAYMKSLIEEEIKNKSPKKMKDGGELITNRYIVKSKVKFGLIVGYVVYDTVEKKNLPFEFDEDELWQAQSRAELSNALAVNKSKKMQDGGTINTCIEFIKKTESILNNGYYLDLKDTNDVRDAYCQFPLNLKGVIITYNSGNQKNLKCIDTINIDFLNDLLENKFKLTEIQSRLVSHYYVQNARRFDTMQITDELIDKDIYIIDRNFLDCSSMSSKMKDGGNIDYNVNDLLGRFVNIFVMGVSEPEYFKIKEVKISPEQYRYRDVTLRGDVGVTKFPLEKLDDFIAGKQILIQDNNEEYAIALTNERFATGGSTKNYISYKDKYNRKYNYPKNTSHSLEEISKDTGVSMKGLQKIFNKGIGAYKTNPESVRPNVTSKEQWAMARVYSAVMGGKAADVDSNELKMSHGGEVGQEITCVNCGWDWNTNKSEEFDKYVCHNCDTDNSMIYAPKKHKEGGLIAPNQKPSNLTPQQYKLVRTPEFKSWFGDWENDPENSSKIVDENGEPKMVYHGTNEKFTIFSLEKVGSNVDYGMWGSGFYFSPIKSFSKGYGSNLLKVFLNIRNPFVRNPNLTGSKTEFKPVYGKEESIQLRNEILNANYDGVLQYESGQKNLLTQIVAFEPEQIKLADGTNTTFDVNNPDIRFDTGGNVDQQDTVTMNIPLLIRTLELVREDVHSDAELHFVVENLLNIKNKKVITMDDYAYIADIEHNHKKKLETGGNLGTNKKEVSIGFGGLGNGTTVWDRNIIQNGDYKIIAHISDFGKITYYDQKLPEDAISKIEAFAEQEKARLAEGGELSQGYDFSPIQTPLN
jgi:hypothetical protein